MKTALKIYIYLCYIVAAPLFLVFSIGVLTHALYTNVRDFGELDFKDSVGAYLRGCMEGHKLNMWKAEHINDDVPFEGLE